jgi:hypothetical protein
VGQTNKLPELQREVSKAPKIQRPRQPATAERRRRRRRRRRKTTGRRPKMHYSTDYRRTRMEFQTTQMGNPN